ncbi:MAG: hypothetical protein WCD35_07005 [Mycobacteriales bacterium]
MDERPDLRLVEDLDGPSPVCTSCGEVATTTSAADGSPLCTKCFTETHWHPSWSRAFEEPEG